MFIKHTVFKKLLKTAYEGGNGLQCGRRNGKIYLDGGYWTIEMDETRIPNKIKAIIIEHIGEFPKENEVIAAHKGERNILDTMEENEWSSMNDFTSGIEGLIISQIMVTGFDNVYQVVQGKESMRTGMLNRMIIDLVDLGAMHSEERFIKGPVKKNAYVYWESTDCRMEALLHRPDETNFEENLMTLLSNNIDLGGK